MHYVYVLHSKKDNNLYVGCAGNLKRRLREHNSGKVYSTRKRVPLEIIYYEGFIDKSDAFSREEWLKCGWGRQHMQKMLSNTLKSLGG
ncbi:GIY-YIG nuclease family protein [Candidatus Saccharibacteria bacterium]|nr:GIY-YIG nuclease family protein [Candidatus Saccharibacteria bacterium]